MQTITPTYFPLVKPAHVTYPKKENLDFDKQHVQHLLESLSLSNKQKWQQ